jgi:Zn-dependent protease
VAVLTEPERTRYDLSWRMFGVPVRVHPLFWLFTAILGANVLKLEYGPGLLVLWILCAFVSLLVHEFGHALAFRWYGTDSQIVLWSFGGLAVPRNEVYGHGRNIIIALAGPVAGFLLLGVVYGTDKLFDWGGTNRFTAGLYTFLFVINLYWGVMNLLPVWPLDGGRVSRELCSSFNRRSGRRISLEISILVAGLVVLYSLACEYNWRPDLLDVLPWWIPPGSGYSAVLFGLLAYLSYQQLQQDRWTEAHWQDDRMPWERR